MIKLYFLWGLRIINCKHCFKSDLIKNGIVRYRQRYKCQNCSYNFVLGDERVKHETSMKRAFAVILYSIGKASYGFIAKLFGVTPPAVLKWLRKEAIELKEPLIDSKIKNIEFDEMWHFIQSKKTKNGSLKQWIVMQGEPLPGLSAIVMLKPSESFMTK